MDFVNKFAQFPYSCVGIRSVRGIPAFGSKIIVRIITPVVVAAVYDAAVIIRFVCFVIIIEVKNR